MKRILLCLLFAVLIAGYGYPAAADQRLDIFIKKTNEFYGTHKPINHVDSPFLPYLGRLFEEGLDKKQRLEFEITRDAGNIIAVADFLETGFRHLYPFLEPALEYPDTRRKIIIYFSSDLLPANRFAVDNLQLKKLFSRWPREDFKPVNVRFSLTLKYSLRRYYQMAPQDDFLSMVLNSIGTLAFCDDYPPAIKKILKTLNRPGGMVLGKADEIYLIGRARIHRLEGLELGRRTRLLAAWMDERRFLNLQAAARVPQITWMESDFGYWPEACLEVEKYRWEKAYK